MISNTYITFGLIICAVAAFGFPENLAPVTTETETICGANETHVFCNAQCPTSYCPTNDGPKPLCSQPHPCPSGCACKANYKLNEDNQCILATECPHIKCTRPNEVFNSCPQPCLPEHCEDLNGTPEACTVLDPYCDPKCVCQEGHYKDNTGTCVPKSQCNTSTVA